MAETMRAAVLTSYGGPLHLTRVPVPETPEAGALVRVAAAGVCRSDLHLRKGELRDLTPMRLPTILGHEITGVVEALGPAAQGPPAGTPVLVYAPVSCGRCRPCLNGTEQMCDSASRLGIGRQGGCAELVAVPRADRQLIALDGLSEVEAAPLGDAALTSYRGIRRVALHLKPDSALVVIGMGGLAQYAVQLARQCTTALVIVAMRHAARREARARELGADVVIDLTGADAGARLRSACPRGAADAVLDAVGLETTMRFGAEALAPGGHLVVVGSMLGRIPFGWNCAPLEATFSTSFWGSLNELHDVLALARRGRLRSDIVTYSLDDIEQAHADLAASRIPGRAVLLPGPGPSSSHRPAATRPERHHHSEGDKE
ncbi:alcohol dehydrogenase catalytic domain-containing protein [Actinomadura rubrisoli]|uniref:alcohol dehydrogenase n=1 Tax=Actinomadura rubrisoli TaxID=2530368 RepID=A0A4R5B9H6_9ACTN|nr:alcohol dehydrogenase catalytic domain-containing protein [Actinomadura rubrisoli]TDD82681.1 alcohol dehydrogenase [Actinomadura rubrisoli]